MTKSYCLTIEVKSDHIENGLGYMIAFSIPKSIRTISDLENFDAWRQDVRDIVMRAGDDCLHYDSYTKKLALATMMHDLAALNSRYDIQIGFLPQTPAVQIHSTNPFDDSIEIDFTDRDGHFKVVEKGLQDIRSAAIAENGKTGLTAVTRRHFPFKKIVTPVDHPREYCGTHRPPRP